MEVRSEVLSRQVGSRTMVVRGSLNNQITQITQSTLILREVAC